MLGRRGDIIPFGSERAPYRRNGPVLKSSKPREQLTSRFCFQVRMTGRKEGDSAGGGRARSPALTEANASDATEGRISAKIAYRNTTRLATAIC